MKIITRYFLLISFLLMFYSTSYSQVSVGLTTGLNLTSVIEDPPQGITLDFGRGQSFGFTINRSFASQTENPKGFGKYFSIMYDQSYAKRGGKYITDSVEFTMRNSYHEIAILFRFTFSLDNNLRLFFNIGPYMSYWTYSKSLYEIDDIGVISTNYINYSDQIEFTKDYSIGKGNFNLGYALGGGLAFNIDELNSFYFEARIMNDLTSNGSYNTNITGLENRYSIYSYNLIIGYMFKLNSSKIFKELFRPKP